MPPASSDATGGRGGKPGRFPSVGPQDPHAGRHSSGGRSPQTRECSRTLADNIAYGRDGATFPEIEAAARLAHLDGDVVGFPNDYETLVGERGVTLSGGQKQRTAIARALLKNPAILILDDPLSAVDAGTEEEILQGLSRYYGDRTVFIVSHRLSALRDCNLIIVLNEGTIMERGTHEELLEMGGLYAAMYREQQLREEIAGY